MVNSIENQIMWVSCPFFCSIAVGQKITAPRKWPCMSCNCHVILPVFRARWTAIRHTMPQCIGTHAVMCLFPFLHTAWLLYLHIFFCSHPIFDIPFRVLTNSDLSRVRPFKRRSTLQNLFHIQSSNSRYLAKSQEILSINDLIYHVKRKCRFAFCLFEQNQSYLKLKT